MLALGSFPQTALDGITTAADFGIVFDGIYSLLALPRNSPEFSAE
jgi:hypothetical protein